MATVVTGSSGPAPVPAPAPAARASFMVSPDPSSNATSLSLLQRARARDPDAWQRLLGLYAPLVQFWCDRAGIPEADRADVVQEVFRAAGAGLGGFRRERAGDTFRGWLRGITRNQIRQHFKQHK